eukprot:scaffold33178_cov55-Attheya_sp.AAC.1
MGAAARRQDVRRSTPGTVPAVASVVVILLLAMKHVSSLLLGAVAVASAQNIVDVAVSNGNFTTLVAAVTAAGLVDTLEGDGPFTVFAPTDD